MITLSHSWANDQTYQVTGIEMIETSVGPFSDQRTQSLTLSATGGVDEGILVSKTHFTSEMEGDNDWVQRSYYSCTTNGWTTKGLKIELAIWANPLGSIWLPLDGSQPSYPIKWYSRLTALAWTAYINPGATVTGTPPFYYECSYNFGRATGVSPTNTSTIKYTVNTAQKGEITINPLPTALTCPVNTDCKTQLTVLVSSTPGRINIWFGAHDNVRYLQANGLQSDEYHGTYDATSTVSDHPIVVSAIVHSSNAGTRIVSVPITAELT